MTIPRDPSSQPDLSPAQGAGASSLAVGQLVGHYVVLQKIGEGRQAAVYKAYDNNLQRNIALKVFTPGGGDEGERSRVGQRILRAAQEWGKIKDHQVVLVYDAGAHEQNIIVAMELVAGTSFRRWLEEKKPSRGQILTVLSAAGQGLVAIHKAGQVHQCFKPENIFIGEDGRVKLSDVGLIDDIGRGESGEAPGVARGTLAPEQRSQQKVDARADQYGFSATLFEALSGHPPAPAKGPGEPRPRGKLPGWLAPAIQRGLSLRPEDRFPSMEALLAELEKDPAPARRGMLAALGAVALIASLVFAARWYADRDRQRCRGAEANLEGKWDPDIRGSVKQAFRATGVSFAAAAFEGVERTLDAYADRWVRMYAAACEATWVSRVQSEELLDQRMLCLQQRLNDLKALVGVLARADRKAVEEATGAASGLAEISECGDLKTLSLRIKPPRDQNTRKKVDEVRTLIAEAQALNNTGKTAEGVGVVSAAVVRARESSYLPVLSEALYQQGNLQNVSGGYAAAEQSLLEALWAGEAGGADELRARAINKLVFIIGYEQGRHQDALNLGREGQSIIKFLGEAQELKVDWYNSMGIVYEH